jgi:hypothetical protein
MSLLARLDKLDSVFIPPPPSVLPPGFTLAREEQRWIDVVLPGLEALDEDAATAFYDEAVHQFEVLASMLEGRYLLGGQETPGHMIVTQRRWPKALALVVSKLPADLAGRLVHSLGRNYSVEPDPPGWRLSSWFRELIIVRGRLPPDARPEVVADIVRGEIALATAPNVFDRSCSECGLHRPARVEAGLAACPHCGSAASSWTHLDDAAEWRALAASELDPDCPERSECHDRRGTRGHGRATPSR